MGNLPNFELSDRVALLTGAANGIGLSVTEAYLRKGASCYVCDLERSKALDDLESKFSDRLFFRFCDVSQIETIGDAVDDCVEKFGRIDILFNNAAVFDMAPLELSDESMFERLFAVNVKGAFFFMQSVAEAMKKNSSATRGKIINMASQAGRRGEALVSHYCATKAAVISYTQSAALALAPHGINVNAISPGVVDTPMWDRVDALFAKYENLQLGEKKKSVGRNNPLGRMGRPGDVAGAAVFLASSASDYVTAQTLNVDGGNVMS